MACAELVVATSLFSCGLTPEVVPLLSVMSGSQGEGELPAESTRKPHCNAPSQQSPGQTRFVVETGQAPQNGRSHTEAINVFV